MDTSVADGYHPLSQGHDEGQTTMGCNETDTQSSNYYEISLRSSLHKADLCNSVKGSHTGDSWSLLSTIANYLESKNLSVQNEVLQKSHKRALFTSHMNRILGDCTLSSLRVKSKLLEERETFCGQKIKECAAHLIFHHILLNSWRKRQKTLDNVLSDNLVLNKSVDNLTLQLKVVRLMDSNEKGKLPNSEKSVQSLKEEMIQSQNESKRLKSTLAAVREEKQSLEVSIHEKSRDNLNFQSKYDLLEIENHYLEQDLEKMCLARGVQESELCDLKLEIVDWKRKVRKSSPSEDNWENKAHSFEAKSWEIRHLIETRGRSIVEYEEQMKKLEEELVHLEREENVLKEKLAGTSNTLAQYIDERFKNRSKLRVIHSKLAEIEIQIQLLSESLEKQWNRNNIDRKLMYDYTLKNVRNRRFWGNTLYYVVLPLKAIQDLLFGFE